MTWTSLADRIDGAPLILVGPMLRRTESKRVTVWLALKELRTVTLFVKDASGTTRMTGSRSTVSFASDARKGRPSLHVVAVTAELVPGEEPLIAEEIYTYDLEFYGSGSTVGLLDAYSSGDYVNDVGLGYGTRKLPSFLLPATTVNRLRIVHASCRKAHGEGRDALHAVDKMLELTSDDATIRPQQLYLTGDQIYGDDVADAMLYNILDAVSTLFHWHEPIAGTANKADDDAYRPGSRDTLVKVTGGMISADHKYAKSHILTIAEYMILYSMAWSDVLWPETLAEFEAVRAVPESEQLEIEFHGQYAQSGYIEVTKNHPDLDQFKKEVVGLEYLRESLPFVRRALANIPTYMAFDDHDVTDDWFVTAEWTRSVLRSSLGRNILRNGLAAYAVFQAWGNTPDRFDEGTPGSRLLAAMSFWFAGAGVSGTDSDEIEAIVGPPELVKPDEVGDPSLEVLQMKGDEDAVLRWDYTMSFDLFRVVVLDTRTHRRFDPSRSHFVGLIDWDEIERQIPTTEDESHGLTLLISPPPVIGFRLAEEVQRLSYLFSLETKLDAEAWCLNESTFARLVSRLALSGLADGGSSGGGGRRHRIVCLSGDVHYASTMRMQYWSEQPLGASAPTAAELVIAQFTSSAASNQAPLTLLLHDGGFNVIPSLLERDWQLSGSAPPTYFSYGWRNEGGGKTVVGMWSTGRSQHVETENKEYSHRAGGPGSLKSFVIDPDWRYRGDYLQDEQETRTHPELSAIITQTSDSFDHSKNLTAQVKDAEELRKLREEHGGGNQLVGRNNIGLVSFEGTEWDDAVAVHKIWWRLDDSDPDPPKPLTVMKLSLGFDDPDYPQPEPGP